MIFEGIKLMVIGMATVLLFLSLMMVLITLASHLTKGITARELDFINTEKNLKAERAAKRKAANHVGEMPIAVIAAAIAAYESENQ